MTPFLVSFSVFDISIFLYLAQTVRFDFSRRDLPLAHRIEIAWRKR
jgi:hypothetical protein